MMKKLLLIFVSHLFLLPAFTQASELEEKQSAFAEKMASLRKDVDQFYAVLKACEVPLVRAEAESGFKNAIEGLQIHEKTVLGAANLAKSTQNGAQCNAGVSDAKTQLKDAKALFDKNTEGYVDSSPKAARNEERLRMAMNLRNNKADWVLASSPVQKEACKTAEAFLSPLKQKKELMEKAFLELTAALDGVACRIQVGLATEGVSSLPGSSAQ